MNNSAVGKEGENLAAKYLISRGCKVIERNYRQKFGEIDIIAKAADGTLLFVEVKALLVTDCSESVENVFHHNMSPEDNLTGAKLMKLKKICQFYASKHDELINKDRGWRIDLIAILLTDGLKCCDVRYYENIA